jgi:peptidase E
MGTAKQQIIALGGGGFSMENGLALDRYIIAQSASLRPYVCFLHQASGESLDYLARFYAAYTMLPGQPSHLSLFKPHTADLEGFLLEQDIVFVGGGNSKSMLALWREWGVDRILRQALENGVVLAGISAGALCWFEWGTTDSIPGALSPIRALGFLEGAFSPHYDGESQRRPRTRHLVQTGAIPAAYGFDDGCAGHWIDGRLHAVVSSRPHARAYRIVQGETEAVETPIEARYIAGDAPGV